MDQRKVILITGEPESGKSFLAKQLTLLFDKVIKYDARELIKRKKYLFKEVYHDTDLIIIDDLPTDRLPFIGVFFGKLLVLKPSDLGDLSSFIETPPTIITISLTKEDVLNLSESIKKWIKHIHCTKEVQENGKVIFHTEIINY